MRKKGQGGVIQGSASLYYTDLWNSPASNYFPLKTTLFCHLCNYNYGTNKIVEPRRQLLELLLDSRPLPRASSSGSGWLSAIIPQTHGLAITYHVYNN